MTADESRSRAAQTTRWTHDLPDPAERSDTTLRILRFDPEVSDRPRWETHRVDLDPSATLLDALLHVKAELDDSLTFRRSCGEGICGDDAVLVNGTNALACKARLGELGSMVTVEPLRGFPVLKDLVVDLDGFHQSHRSVLPWLIAGDDPAGSERIQSPDQRARVEDAARCILCAACTTACPVTWAGAEWVGPASIVSAHRFVFDSRDQAATERLEVLEHRSGVFRCRTTYNCTNACPRGIAVTAAIQDIKRAAAIRDD